MRIGRPPETNRTRVVVLTADTAFEETVRATFGTSSAIELVLIAGRLAEHSDTLDTTGGGNSLSPAHRKVKRFEVFTPSPPLLV